MTDAWTGASLLERLRTCTNPARPHADHLETGRVLSLVDRAEARQQSHAVRTSIGLGTCWPCSLRFCPLLERPFAGPHRRTFRPHRFAAIFPGRYRDQGFPAVQSTDLDGALRLDGKSFLIKLDIAGWLRYIFRPAVTLQRNRGVPPPARNQLLWHVSNW